ncbi:hypothetical protein D3C76_1589450 [compost metagenome]
MAKVGGQSLDRRHRKMLTVVTELQAQGLAQVDRQGQRVVGLLNVLDSAETQAIWRTALQDF